MSNISNRHTVNPFVAGKSEALIGQRLAKVGYKQTDKMTKAGETALPGICVSVPPIDTSAITGAILDGFMPHLVTLIETAQEGIIRSMNDSSGGTLSAVTDDDISLSAVLAYLSAESAGSRLSQESIGVWFTAQVEDNLSVLIVDKLKFTDITEDNQPVIDKHVKQYRDICMMICGKGLHRNSLSDTQKRTIRTCVKIAADDIGISAKITAKLNELEKMVDPADALELDN